MQGAAGDSGQFQSPPHLVFIHVTHLKARAELLIRNVGWDR